MGGLTATGAPRRSPEHVFAYGSLVADLADGGRPALLRDHRRVWGVAADNRAVIPGYKRYRAPDGSFPAVFVAFLDVVPAPSVAVNGVVAPVDPATWDELDRRERNYDRVEVTAAIDFDGHGRVWTYVGSDAGRARLRAGLAAGTAVVQRAYRDRVRAALAALGPSEADRFVRASELDSLPIADLERVDLPPAEDSP